MTEALRASLRGFKREIVRCIRQKATAAGSPKLRAVYFDKLVRLRAMKPAAFRTDYINHRVREIRLAPLAELHSVVPTLVILRTP